MVRAAEGCGVLGGLMGCKPAGVSAKMWKWEVGGGPINVGLESMSTWRVIKLQRMLKSLQLAFLICDYYVPTFFLWLQFNDIEITA